MSRVLLHAGCGSKTIANLPRYFQEPDWSEIRLDIDPTYHPDIVASILDMRQVTDQTVDAVYSSHNLEHLRAHEVALALREFRRVLKPEGLAVVTCPDLESVAAAISTIGLDGLLYRSPIGPITPLDILYGHGASLAEGKTHMAHRTGFTSKLLAKAMLSAGFSQVTAQRDDGYNLWAIGFLRTRTPLELKTVQEGVFPLAP